MSEDDDTGYLLLLRANFANMTDAVEGSTVVTANCGHKAFISPQGRAELERRNNGLYLMCTQCQDVEALLQDKDQEKTIVPGAVSAISKHLGWGVGQEDQFRAALRDFGVTDGKKAP